MSVEVPDLLEPVSELNVANIGLYARLLGAEAVTLSIPETIVLSEN